VRNAVVGGCNRLRCIGITRALPGCAAKLSASRFNSSGYFIIAFHPNSVPYFIGQLDCPQNRGKFSGQLFDRQLIAKRERSMKCNSSCNPPKVALNFPRFLEDSIDTVCIQGGYSSPDRKLRTGQVFVGQIAATKPANFGAFFGRPDRARRARRHSPTRLADPLCRHTLCRFKHVHSSTPANLPPSLALMFLLRSSIAFPISRFSFSYVAGLGYRCQYAQHRFQQKEKSKC